MKRLYTMFFTLMLTVIMSAQSISVDRIESDGRHQIMTTSKNFYIDDTGYYFSMKIYEKPDGIDWCLLISSFKYIPSNTEILLKLGNDDYIYLPCNNVQIGSVTKPGHGTIIGNFILTTPTKNIDYYTSIYELTPEKIDKIEKFGIKKIRISTGEKYRDRTIHRNLLGKFVVRCRKKIQERLDNPPKKKTLFDDF